MFLFWCLYLCIVLGGFRDGPLELWGEWEIFEPQEFFSLTNSLYEFF